MYAMITDNQRLQGSGAVSPCDQVTWDGQILLVLFLACVYSAKHENHKPGKMGQRDINRDLQQVLCRLIRTARVHGKTICK